VWSWWKTGSIHRAEWPRAEEIDAHLISGRHADDVAYARAREITARIRHERSLASLGFGTPVRASLMLAEVDRAVWPVIERDVLAGNNVVAADVTFGAGDLAASITPEAPHA
jgi:valyl-tRNA synthetase